MDIFKEKLAIVRGEASSIGKSQSKQIAGGSAKFVKADVDSMLLAEIVESIKKSGGRARPVTLNVSEKEFRA